MFLPVLNLFFTGILLFMALMMILQFQRIRSQKHEERERSTMVALLSHRLRGPLSAIKWNTELLLNQDMGKLQIAQMELINKMSLSIADAITVLNTFLEASRIERGELTTAPVALDLLEYLPRIMESYRGLLDEKKQTIELTKPQERILVFMDPLILHTIVEVVLHNAILYTPNGGSLRVSIDSPLKTQRKVLLHIADTGIGMSPDDMKNLFTKFFRSQDAKKLSTMGNGLGLYLVKQMLKTIGGSISCTSELRKGTVVTIGLPKA